MRLYLFLILCSLSLSAHMTAQEFQLNAQLPLWKLDPSLATVSGYGFGPKLGIAWSPKQGSPLSVGLSGAWVAMPALESSLKLSSALAILGIEYQWYQGKRGNVGPYAELGWGLSFADQGASAQLLLGGQVYGNLGMRYLKYITPHLSLGAGLGLGVLVERERAFYNPELALSLGYLFKAPSANHSGKAVTQDPTPAIPQGDQSEIQAARKALNAMTDVQVIGTPAMEGERIVIHSSFVANGTGLTPWFNEQIPGIIRYLKSLNNLKSIEIQGYVADDGSKDDGIELSLERARVVKKLLEGAFPEFKGSWLIQGKGRVNPMADNKTEKGRRLNRRIEIILHTKS